MSVFLDFDGTITARDTIGELANFALRFRADAEGVDLQAEWDEVVKAYVADHRARADGYRPPPDARGLPDQEIEFLRHMKAVETRSLGRINECALFKGIGAAAFRDAGRALVRDGTIALRPGFRDFVDRRLAQGWRVWVVSVNWSSAFIEGACGHPDVAVVANDVREDGSIAGPAVLNPAGAAEPRNLTNSCDKLDAVRGILEAETLTARPSVYFGDSTTDLECLLAASRGIVIADRDDSTLLKTLRRIGKEVPHVRDAGARSSLAWASHFEDIPDKEFSLD
ncbi:haloacid dehalogenase-like hydrolase-domain-containing protein [Xylariaceae sp. FL0662B]|nr:haloacid dehalogenase-like hydrolase-domain-containing protein [Xylariaceae sp. FL0662B]